MVIQDHAGTGHADTDTKPCGYTLRVRIARGNLDFAHYIERVQHCYGNYVVLSINGFQCPPTEFLKKLI